MFAKLKESDVERMMDVLVEQATGGNLKAVGMALGFLSPHKAEEAPPGPSVSVNQAVVVQTGGAMPAVTLARFAAVLISREGGRSWGRPWPG